MSRELIQVCAILLLPTAVLGAVTGTGQIRVLAIGQVLPGESPIQQWFNSDPLIDYVLVPTDVDTALGFGPSEFQRFVRVYFPKTRKALVEGFDFLLFPDGKLDPFTPSQIADMRYAVEKGLGAFVTMGGGLSNPSGSVYPSWANSVLREILPVELNARMKQDTSVFTIRVVKDDPPLLSMFVPLGIETFQGTWFTHLTTRPGATVWARLKVVATGASSLGLGKEGDWLVSHRVGATGGIFWVVADDLDAPWWSSIYIPSRNQYAGDVFINILLHSKGAPLPQDVFQLHRLRQLYFNYNVESSLVTGLLEFADNLGANTRDLYLKVEKADKIRQESFEKYRSYEFADAMDLIESAMSTFMDLRKEALRLKDRALLWIYFTEWAAVTGTTIVCGFVIWTLMVRRRLYREVPTTRLGA